MPLMKTMLMQDLLGTPLLGEPNSQPKIPTLLGLVGD